MPPDPKTPPPFRFGPPEKRRWGKLILMWVFIVIAVAGIVWMVKTNPRQRPLTCSTAFGVATSFSSFGTCKED